MNLNSPLPTPSGEVSPAQSPVVTPVSAPRSSKVTATAQQALPSAAPSAPLPATSSPPKTQSDDVLPFEFTISHENQLVLKQLNSQDETVMKVAGKKGSNLLQKIDLRYVTLTVPIKDASGKQINAVSFRVHIEDLSKATGLSVPKILAAKMGKGSLKLAVLRNVLGKPELGFAQGLSLVQAARVQHLAQTALRENANPQVVDLKSLNIKTYQSMIVSPERGIVLETAEKIGEGGMKVITGATTLSGQPLVAAKFKKPEENRDLCETVAAFTARCQGLDTSHVLIPHVIRPVTNGQAGDPILVAERKSSEMFRFMAAQWDQGQSITAKSGVSNRDAVQVLHDIADGTAVIHRAGYAHRDLKPENVLLDRTKDGRLRAVVHDLDFLTTGKDTDTPMTCPKDQKSTTSGTRGFIPPEFYTPGQYGEKSVGTWLQKHDCFSFGVLACEWLGLQHSPEWNAFYAGVRDKANPESLHAILPAMVAEHDKQINTLERNDHLYEAKKLALEMCHPDPDKRPDMAAAKQRLEKLLIEVGSKSAG